MQALSYYKVFGYPTGLGALLVRKDALKCLGKRYFGGGAVSVCVADRNFFRCVAVLSQLCTHLSRVLPGFFCLASVTV